MTLEELKASLLLLGFREETNHGDAAYPVHYRRDRLAHFVHIHASGNYVCYGAVTIYPARYSSLLAELVSEVEYGT